MCKCVNVSFGSYDRQTNMKTPQDKWVCIDTCLVQEIAELWYLDIETIECCCGHNKNVGYILVSEKHKKKMTQLGYIPQKRSGFFNPKQN